MELVLDNKTEEIQVDESTFRDACCEKAAGELEMLLEDIVNEYSNRGSEKLAPFKGALKQIRSMEKPICSVVKNYLNQIAKKDKGEAPKGMKVNPLVQRARDILKDLERCEGVKKGWFATLKTT